jgi:hypothetical protein
MMRDNHRVKELDEELLVAKEVSVRLHRELEKSEEVRINTEKLNRLLKQQLDTVKESLDDKLIQVKRTNEHTHVIQIYCLNQFLEWTR